MSPTASSGAGRDPSPSSFRDALERYYARVRQDPSRRDSLATHRLRAGHSPQAVAQMYADPPKRRGGKPTITRENLGQFRQLLSKQAARLSQANSLLCRRNRGLRSKLAAPRQRRSHGSRTVRHSGSRRTSSTQTASRGDPDEADPPGGGLTHISQALAPIRQEAATRFYADLRAIRAEFDVACRRDERV